MKTVIYETLWWAFRAAVIYYCAKVAWEAAPTFWMWTKMAIDQSRPMTPWGGWQYSRGALEALAWQTGAAVIGVLMTGRIYLAVPVAIAALVLIQLPAALLVLFSICTIFLSFMIILSPPLLILVIACIASGAAICGAAAFIVFAELDD